MTGWPLSCPWAANCLLNSGGGQIRVYPPASGTSRSPVLLDYFAEETKGSRV